MVDVLTVVSSDKRFPLDVSALMASGQVRLVHTFRTGAECLRSFEIDSDTARKLVLIDGVISDISSANLCDALRMAYPNLGLIMVTDKSDVECVQRAMLAGARDIIDRSASTVELERVIERVNEITLSHMTDKRNGSGSFTLPGSHRGRAESFLPTSESASVIVSVIGARGGAGRSSIASVLAWLAAESSVDTALVDFDLQFGDLGFLFGATGQQSPQHEHTLSDFLQHVANTSDGTSPRRFGRVLTPNLTLLAPLAVPEKAELMASSLPSALDALRREFELVVVNTGAFWTLFHAELLERSDSAVVVLDQTVVGVRATKMLRDLCRRLGVPPSRLVYVMNRVRSDGLRAGEVAEVLHTDEVFCVREADQESARDLDNAAIAQLCERGAAFVAELAAVLDELALRNDLALRNVTSMRFALRRSGSRRG